MPEKKIVCSFCGKPESKNRLLAVDRTGNHAVCQECAVLLYDQFDAMLYADDEPKASTQHKERRRPNRPIEPPSPSEMVAELDKAVVGHEKAKKILAVAVYNHYKRLNGKRDNIKLGKSNILLIGPTGSGKTFLLENIAEQLNVPFVTVDATAFTQKGYVGMDTEAIVLSLVNKTNGNVKKAQRGIVYIDEVDKLASPPGINHDVGGKGVQQDLLKMMENTTIPLAMSDGTQEEFSTKDILFICGGAFSELDDIIGKRKKKTVGIGFSTSAGQDENQDRLTSGIKVEDLVEFGMMPEFIGRTPVIARLGKLTQSEMEQVLSKVEGNLASEYQKMLKMDGVDLEFTQDAITEIAKQALAANTGARALRGICENVLLDIMYQAPKSKLRKAIITKEAVLGKKPELIWEKPAQKEKNQLKPIHVANDRQPYAIANSPVPGHQGKGPGQGQGKGKERERQMRK